METAKRNVPVFSTAGDYVIGEICCGQKTVVLGETQEGKVIAYILGIIKQEHSDELVDEEAWESSVSEKHRLLWYADSRTGSTEKRFMDSCFAQREQQGQNLYGVCTAVNKADIRTGDLIFDHSSHCIGVYMGDGSAVVESENGQIQREDLSKLKKACFGRPKHAGWDEEEAYYSRRLKSLRKRMLGDDIRAVQEALESLGQYSGKTDGAYDRRTQKAVKRFQQKSGLKADGIVDYETWTNLKKVVRRWKR